VTSVPSAAARPAPDEADPDEADPDEAGPDGEAGGETDVDGAADGGTPDAAGAAPMNRARDDDPHPATPLSPTSRATPTTPVRTIEKS
jgi:hypothetical protein